MSSRSSGVEAQLPTTHAAFEQALVRQHAGGACFSATLDGAEIITFCGTSSPWVKWVPDIRTITMSMAKGPCRAGDPMLVDKGKMYKEIPGSIEAFDQDLEGLVPSVA